MLRSKKFVISILVFLTLATFAFVYVEIRSMSRELDEKFIEAHDSVPTRVFSSPYIFRPGVGASIDELRYRLREREYHEVLNESQVGGAGQYSLELSNGLPSKLTIITNDFPYVDLAKEVLFGSNSVDLRPIKRIVSWKNGEVEKVFLPTGEILPFMALEPVLVAQLNQRGAQARKTIPIGEIPHTLMEAIVLTEDQRFLEHRGIDPRGILRSMYVNLRSGSYVQGASTITQQLTRNILFSRQKTMTRKIKEMAMAVVLEFKYSKDQILEKYLNEVFFGQSGNIAVHGVSEAAKFYFGKNLDELTTAEQALLAGLVRGPFLYSPFRHWDKAKLRQEIVLKKLFEGGAITEPQYKAAIKEKIKLARVNLVQNRAPYFTDMIEAQLLKDLNEQEVVGAGYTIYSTLDTYYQSLAEQNVAKGVENIESRLKVFLSKKKKEDEARLVQGLFLAIEPSSGHLLAMVGGRSYEESNYNRALLMRRQVGSLMKPFVYLAGLMYGKNPVGGGPMNAITKYEDKPFEYQYDNQSWSPKNYEDDFNGMVTLRYALAHSINTVAARVAIDTGLDKLVEVAKAAGIDADLQAFPSLSLGAVDVAPMSVAGAYTTLANYGIKKEITATLLVLAEDGHLIGRFHPQEGRVLPQDETANLVNMMTSVFEIGTAKLAKDLGFTWPASGKTGTTNEFRDAWFAGFTNKVLAISWVGFDRDDEFVRKHRKALKLTGAVAALPVWAEFMKSVHKNQPPHAIIYPEGSLNRVEVDLITGNRANNSCRGNNVVEEVFTNHNMPRVECN